jgi:hypothetical protein
MIHKFITYCGQSAVIACDENCYKAWGHSHRPHEHLSDDEDDIVWLADEEIGIAPIDPGTYEGDDAKPTKKSDRLNKWCCRECERCDMADQLDDIELPDYSQRVYNIPRKAET